METSTQDVIVSPWTGMTGDHVYPNFGSILLLQTNATKLLKNPLIACIGENKTPS
jgi:hypothetical protein